MRTSLMVLASLLFLLLLATRAHGIRLDRQLHEAINGKERPGDSEGGQSSNVAVAHSMNKHCTSDGQCSGKWKKPPAPHAEPGKAATKHQSSKQSVHDDTTAVVGATPGIGRHKAEPVTSHGGRQDQEAPPRQTTTTYPDVLDIAGMDYSPAARKPPIHN